MKLLFAACAIMPALAQTWVMQPSGTTASLRGLSAVDAKVAWASGTGGTFLRTVDGATWRAAVVPGAESLDFRDVEAFDARTAYLLSSAPGDKSRVYKTTDGGASWTLQFTNPDPKGFFDALAFWDGDHGILAGDPVDGHLTVFTTDDGGKNWERQPGPVAIEGEGAFAASGTCLIATSTHDAWLVTGGPHAARVHHSTDRGRHWTTAATPIRNDAASAGIFSIAFSDPRHGIAVGGDYGKPDDATGNIAITSDGGATWTAPGGAVPHGFLSAVVYVAARRLWIATGTSGSDTSADGLAWKQFDRGAFNAIAFDRTGAGWAVGPKGRIATFQK